MESHVKALFQRYENAMNRALAGKPDLEETATFYAAAFVVASPAGVMAGKNDDALNLVPGSTPFFGAAPRRGSRRLAPG